MQQTANPKTLIVATLTRDEILEMETTEESEIFAPKRRVPVKKAAHAKGKAKELETA